MSLLIYAILLASLPRPCTHGGNELASGREVYPCRIRYRDIFRGRRMITVVRLCDRVTAEDKYRRKRSFRENKQNVVHVNSGILSDRDLRSFAVLLISPRKGSLDEEITRRELCTALSGQSLSLEVSRNSANG